jgi:hypothetical protein
MNPRPSEGFASMLTSGGACNYYLDRYSISMIEDLNPGSHAFKVWNFENHFPYWKKYGN